MYKPRPVPLLDFVANFSKSRGNSSPFDKKIIDAVSRLMAKGVHIKYLPEALSLTVTFLIVDRKFSMTAELVNDYTEIPTESLGLTTFSNSKATVLYYISYVRELVEAVRPL